MSFTFLEHLSSNRLINYPFKENIDLPPEIKKDFIADMVFSTNITPPIFLSRMEIVAPTPTSDGNAKLFFNGIEMFDICLTTNPDLSMCNKLLTFDSTNAKVKLVVGNNVVNNITSGTFNYTVNETQLEDSVVVPYPSKVTSLNDLVGDVNIKEGFNMSLVSTPNNNQVSFSAIPGAGLGRTPCELKEEEDFIRTINNEAKGFNFIIKNTDCIEVINEPANNMIVIHNRCSPCCEEVDCELTDEEAALNALIAELDDLESRIAALE